MRWRASVYEVYGWSWVPLTCRVSFLPSLIWEIFFSSIFCSTLTSSRITYLYVLPTSEQGKCVFLGFFFCPLCLLSSVCWRCIMLLCMDNSTISASA
ncbi:hypothetical protein QR685DRAFT_179111 [Neurospora intermedia]|uniref:Uncharacterized protein n=1 Tax=Neurospora intermedia TaxID=5142 RepID=A0ABR3DMJ3_NEUIN